MNKEAYKMLKEVGILKRFIVMMILRSPFDIFNSVLAANLMSSYIRIVERGEKDKLLFNTVLFLILTILLFAYNMTVWSMVSAKTTVILHTELRKKVFEKIMELPSEELQGTSGSDWFTRINNDIDKACGYLTMPLNYMHMIVAIVNVVISSIIMICMNLELFAIGFVLVITAFLLNVFLISGKITEYKTNAQKSLVEYTDWIDVAVKDREILAIFEGENFVREQIEDKSLGILRENMKAHNRVSLCNMTYAFSGMLGYLMILVRGNDIMGNGISDFGDLCKMTQYRSNSVASFFCIYNCINNMKGNYVGVERVNEVILREKN